MKLSSKTTTAIKMFIDLGEHYQDGFISLKDIAERKDLSKKFLEQIVPIYKNNGLLLGNRGNQGGYRLAKKPQAINVKAIIYTLENGFEKQDTGSAPINTMMNKVDNMLDNYFSNISLAELVEKQKESYSYSYSI